MSHRVAVTGIGVYSPIGCDRASVVDALRTSRSAVRRIDAWDAWPDLRTRLGAPVDGALPSLPRKLRRSIGRVGHLAIASARAAVADAGLSPDQLSDGTCGVAFGSTQGSSAALEAFCRSAFAENRLTDLGPSDYLRVMSHTCAANLALAFGIRGRVLTTCSACTSGSQGIGYAYEQIRGGYQRRMLAGGAEELHVIPAAVFDMLLATSHGSNDAPDRAPRPFDAARDGLVVGEGAATLALERWDDARARGATIHGEVIGFGTNCDGGHITAPSVGGMAAAMQLALDDAGLEPDAIDYVNAHATSTEIGDIRESEATAAVFGARVPVSSTKGLMGHTLGASGAIEAAIALYLIAEGFVPPTHNLRDVDPRCASLDYVVGGPRSATLDRVVSNNFAFGGVNTSLVFGRV